MSEKKTLIVLLGSNQQSVHLSFESVEPVFFLFLLLMVVYSVESERVAFAVSKLTVVRTVPVGDADGAAVPRSPPNDFSDRTKAKLNHATGQTRVSRPKCRRHRH